MKTPLYGSFDLTFKSLIDTHTSSSVDRVCREERESCHLPLKCMMAVEVERAGRGGGRGVEGGGEEVGREGGKR